MLNLVISFIFGVFITIWYLVLDFTFSFDHAMAINIIIAAATIIATTIHFDSVRAQRKDRLWEINKDSILRLSKVLADAIDISSKYCDSTMGIPVGNSLDKSAEIGKAFEDALSDSLNVYKPLLSEELILAIEEYQKEEQMISKAWHSDEYTTYDAYENQLASRKKLQVVVLKFIKDVSGVSYT